MEHNVLESILDGSMKPGDLPLSLLEKITDGFSEERKIGEGGFAVVYKGVLQNGKVAVKRIMSCKTINEKLFRREVNSLMQVNHQNIVRFLGFCSNTVHKALEQQGEYILAENRERLLCFEYINKGSLDKYITDELRGLEWNTRYNIIKGICNGLEYLHMKRGIIHMDLKPANILLDNDMIAKITDFGLSRTDKNLQTKTTNRYCTPPYCAPEYLEGGEISVKCDMYSLGVIIIELVAGRRRDITKENVLRRWRHRWNKSGQETPFRYQQVAKLIEIGLLCKENDPYKRPFISKIIRNINELKSTDRQIINADESTIGQISPYSEDDMLGIEPLELRFPFELNKEMSCSLQLTNETKAYIAFSIETTSPLTYCIQPTEGIVAPRYKYSVNITLQPLDKAPQCKQNTSEFIVRSTKVNDGLTSEAITEDMFNKQEGKVVDEVNLMVVHEPREPHVDLPLESLTISGTGNLNSLEASNVPAEAESKTSSLIQFDPPELRFPFLPNKRVSMVCVIKIVNVTDHYVGFITWGYSNSNLYYVGFNTRGRKYNSAGYQMSTLFKGILPPRSTQALTVYRVPKEKESEDMQCKEDVFGVWNGIVAEGVEAADLRGCVDNGEIKQLPIVFTKTSLLCTSDKLIQFDPPELHCPCLPNKRVPMVWSIKIVNVTDHYVGFNTWVYNDSNLALYHTATITGILPPRSAQALQVKRVVKKNKSEDMQCTNDVFGVWNGMVAEGVQVPDLTNCGMVAEGVQVPDLTNCGCAEGSKQLPIVFTKTSLLCTSDELIQFDPPELRFPFLPNKRVSMVCVIKIVNVTDHYVGFNRWLGKDNSAWYDTDPFQGILPPRSTQAIKVRRVPKEKESQDMQCKDDVIGVWNGIVTEGVEATDLSDYMEDEESKQLPIVFTKTSLLYTSDELIQFDPPEVRFPLPNKRVPMFCSIKIVNITDLYVGFFTCHFKGNSASYDTFPDPGILPPRSAQELTIIRQSKEKESEDMECKDDMFGVWNGIVTEGVKVTDFIGIDPLDDEFIKQLPIVFTKPAESTSA